MNIISDTLLALLKAQNLKIATAESCTGGLLAAYLTEKSGSSAWFERGFVTYSNEAKIEMLGVKQSTLEHYGAVSEQTAKEMAEGALNNSRADLSIAITGIAGPDGGSADKPVGMVCFGFAGKNIESLTQTKYFEGDRKAIREQAAQFALEKLEALLCHPL
jgi:nicotinamide-nucleotide amidase